jgi:hypothetical protein
MTESITSSLRAGRLVQIHGHEIVVHTQRLSSAQHLSFVFLSDPHNNKHELKIFRGKGATAEEAENSTLREALSYLDRPADIGVSSILAARSTLHVEGRKVDVFCDLLPDGRIQAFPFLYRPDGKRVIIMRFHLGEAITGRTTSEAFSECVRRLEEYFRRGEEPEGETHAS